MDANKNRDYPSYWATALDPANMVLNVLGGVITLLITPAVNKWLGVENSEWWFASAIGFGVFVVLMLLGGWLRLRRLRQAVADEKPQAITLSQSVSVGGHQMAPNINANAPNANISVNIVHDHAAAAVQDAVTKGNAPEILSSFQRQQQALKSFDPFWVIDTQISGDGKGSIGLRPRVPEAYRHSPITGYFAAQTTEQFPDLNSVLRHVYVTGKPVTLNVRDFRVNVGSKRFFEIPIGEVTVGVPDDSISHSVIKLSVPAASISYDYIKLAIRTYDGVVYMDNSDQADCPIVLTSETEPNGEGRIGRHSLSFKLSQFGVRSTKHVIKFLSMLKALAEGAVLHVTNLITEQSGVLPGGDVIEVDDLDVMSERLKWWNKVADLERHLARTFVLPGEPVQDDFEAVEHLWAILVQRKAEHQIAPETYELTTDLDTARQIVSSMGNDRLCAIRGQHPSEDVHLFGTKIRLPERRVMLMPLRLVNPEVVLQGNGNVHMVTLLFSSDRPVTVTEEPLD